MQLKTKMIRITENYFITLFTGKRTKEKNNMSKTQLEYIIRISWIKYSDEDRIIILIYLNKKLHILTKQMSKNLENGKK